jgi:ATP-dependent Clp protease adaptor protein ClpS
METPMSAQHSDSTVLEREAVAEKQAFRPPKFAVVLLNDDFTPMDFVIVVLMEIFGKNIEDAMQLMFEVHEKGRGVCGTFVRDAAETLVSETEEFAKLNGHPLKCVMEPETPAPSAGNGGARRGPRA